MRRESRANEVQGHVRHAIHIISASFNVLAANDVSSAGQVALDVRF